MCLNQHFTYIDNKNNTFIDNLTIAFAGNSIEKVVKKYLSPLSSTFCEQMVGNSFTLTAQKALCNSAE